MTSIFHKALGSDFERLHPKLQERFGVCVDCRRACVGTGVMDRIWRGSPALAPFLHLGATRNLLFPETGTAVPFRIENFAYRDGLGRETVTFVRTFELAPWRRRRFDATMVLDPERNVVVDLLGTHQHLATDLDLLVDPHGGLTIRSAAYRAHPFGIRLALPRSLAGDAVVRESFDDDTGCFRIRVEVTNRLVGPVFGYHGWFTARFPSVGADEVPWAVKPYRECRV